MTQPQTVADADAPRPEDMPTVRLGEHAISRLICGANCFSAGSHLSVFVNAEMRAWYTPQRILATLRRCEEVGINCWQSSPGHHLDLYKRHIAEGGAMRYVSLACDDPRQIADLVDGGCIAIAHHGEETDKAFKAGRLESIRDYLKRIRDAGVQVGVSTHMPDVIDAIESAGWDVDFYMTCVYERHRTAEELRALLGHVPIPVGEVYVQEDPPRMFRAIRQTARPCLAFKILAAGRLSERPEWVEDAFRRTFEAIKPTDAVIVGIYDRYSDQPAENAALTRRFGRVTTA